jgi:hypothetical protein
MNKFLKGPEKDFKKSLKKQELKKNTRRKRTEI